MVARLDVEGVDRLGVAGPVEGSVEDVEAGLGVEAPLGVVRAAASVAVAVAAVEVSIDSKRFIYKAS